MSRQVFCRKYQKEMEGLDFAPFPGAKGQEFFENVSKQAWQEWLQHQTTLINEKRLNVFDPEAKNSLKNNVRSSSIMMKALKKQKVGSQNNSFFLSSSSLKRRVYIHRPAFFYVKLTQTYKALHRAHRTLHDINWLTP